MHPLYPINSYLIQLCQVCCLVRWSLTSCPQNIIRIEANWEGYFLPFNLSVVMAGIPENNGTVTGEYELTTPEFDEVVAQTWDHKIDWIYTDWESPGDRSLVQNLTLKKNQHIRSRSDCSRTRSHEFQIYRPDHSSSRSDHISVLGQIRLQLRVTEVQIDYWAKTDLSQQNS